MNCSRQEGMGRMRAKHLPILVAASGLLLALGHPSADGQTGGVIGLYSDTQGVDCGVLDAAPGVLEVYVVHSLASDEIDGVCFAVPIPTCAAGLMYIGDRPTGLDPEHSVFGSSPVGVGVAYGACFPTTPALHILTIVYISDGTSQSCCPLQVSRAVGDEFLPYPNPGASTCHNLLVPVEPGTAYLNPNASCMCTVPTNSTTWGALKALYDHEGL